MGITKRFARNLAQASLGLIVLGTLAACGSSTGGSESSSTTTTTASAGGGFDDLSGLSLTKVSSLDGGSAQNSMNLPTTSKASKYLVAVVPASGSSTPTVQLSSTSAPTTASSTQKLGLNVTDPVKPEEPEESQFHQYLMEIGDYLNESGQFQPVQRPTFAGLTKSLSTGDTQTFRVLSSMSSLSQYETVSATLRLKTSNLLIYVDNQAASLVADSDIQTLANDFEGIALPLERKLFGHESDINNDGTMTILMTPILNKMASSGGLVTGFFCPCDLYSQSSGNPSSNQMEIFYTMVPDPKGSFGPTVSSDFTIHNILPGVLAHEYQHMDSFQQHVFLNKGSTEVSWLNEALSHFAEDITGFNRENYSRVRLALANPQTSPLTPASSPGLAERGMGYLFVRYLYEQSANGEAFISRLYNSATTGKDNVEQAFAGTSNFATWNDFVKRWSMAIALSETGVTGDPAYNYQARTLHSQTGNYMGVCLRCDTQDGRGTILNGPAMVTPTSFPLSTSVEASAIQFFLINNSQSAISLNVSNTSGVIGTVAELQ